MKTLSMYGVVTLTMLALASPLYAAGDITKAKDDANVKALTGETGEKKTDMGPSATGKYEVDVGSETAMKNDVSRDELAGMKVISKDGEQIGQIDFIYPMDENEPIQYVTLSNVGQYGIGSAENVAVPLAALSFEGDRAKLIVDVNKLKNAPMQAEHTDENFQMKLHEHYGVSPEWKEKPAN